MLKTLNFFTFRYVISNVHYKLATITSSALRSLRLYLVVVEHVDYFMVERRIMAPFLFCKNCNYKKINGIDLD
jgi:hypothetical protein